MRFPSAGRPRDELVPDLRGLAVGDYVIYYTHREDLVRIERVLHGARDREAFFG